MEANRHPVGTVLPGGEPKLSVRIIGRCNFRCSACSTFSGPERSGRLSSSDFGRILDVLAENDFRGVVNLSGGETTLHPGLGSFVFQAASRLPGAKVVVFTNGDWVGRGRWRDRLRSLLRENRVLVRFSIDGQHAEGKARALALGGRTVSLEKIERERLEKASLFLEACLAENAVGGRNFDFAFKGTVEEAKDYLASLGDVPVYPIAFQKDPSRRPDTMGYLAVDLEEDGRPRVYLTLGHAGRREAMGGIESLGQALRMNRRALGLPIRDL